VGGKPIVKDQAVKGLGEERTRESKVREIVGVTSSTTQKKGGCRLLKAIQAEDDGIIL